MVRLLAHSAAARGPVRSFEVDAGRGDDGLLRLAWRLEADLWQLRVPAPAAPLRADDLWRHTCFEVFIATPRSPAYCELNFSPSGEWAAYAFTSYRAGMTPLALAAAPQARWRRDAGQLELEVIMPQDGAGSLRLALAAVIEELSGTMTWWALWHPQGKPDFHHAEAFALELAGVEPGAERGTDRS